MRGVARTGPPTEAHPTRGFLTMTALLLLLNAAFAHSNGMDGYSTSGCGDCHGRSASDTTTATFSTDTSTVAPGDTIDVSFLVSSSKSSETAAGLDVSATGGTLAAGSNTKVKSHEITHKSATAMSGGVTTFDFTWTAPSAAGTYTLKGVGNAVNDNGSENGDYWNLASNLTLTVAAADTGGDTDTDTGTDTGTDTDTGTSSDTGDSGGDTSADSSSDSGGGDTGGADTATSAPKTCGCSTGSAPTGAFGVLGLLGLALARRRRQQGG